MTKIAESASAVQRSVTKVALLVVFLAFGTVLPWDRWPELGWGGAAFALWVLLRHSAIKSPHVSDFLISSFDCSASKATSSSPSTNR